METHTRWLFLETTGLEAVIIHGAAHSKSRGGVWCHWIGGKQNADTQQVEVYGSRITMYMPTLSLHGPKHELWCTNNQPSRTIGYGDVGQLHNGQKLSVNWGQSDSTEGKALSLHKTNPSFNPHHPIWSLELQE